MKAIKGITSSNEEANQCKGLTTFLFSLGLGPELSRQTQWIVRRVLPTLAQAHWVGVEQVRQFVALKQEPLGSDWLYGPKQCQ